MSRPVHALRQQACAAALVLLLLGGCASMPGAGTGTATVGQKADPFEAVNRRIFAFNDAVDEAVVKPVAEAYRKWVPSLVRTGVGNVLGNLVDVWSTANHFLQGKAQVGLEMGMRVLTNSVFGLGGLLDPASELGLGKRSEDFGQTLGRWGVGPGPYLVLPLLGPSTVRDTVALPVDMQFSPSTLPAEASGQFGVTVLSLVHLRAGLLATTNLVDQVALDRYSFVRDATLARRLNQVYDGAPPLESFDDEPAEAPEPANPAPKPATVK